MLSSKGVPTSSTDSFLQVEVWQIDLLRTELQVTLLEYDRVMKEDVSKNAAAHSPAHFGNHRVALVPLAIETSRTRLGPTMDLDDRSPCRTRNIALQAVPVYIRSTAKKPRASQRHLPMVLPRRSQPVWPFLTKLSPSSVSAFLRPQPLHQQAIRSVQASGSEFQENESSRRTVKPRETMTYLNTFING
ncbi:hypothetical protein SeMB42_g00371 [Synchytrium endobioticum]|uniref:Uncharacterized protein n=1 Tax=Synchytrium endobioticum TaxID=286115 RepID=A0A507DSQ5_9FUNG|nr:hypothetical protein SeMB42_g00371 [Synchytrium endobioticum]